MLKLNRSLQTYDDAQAQVRGVRRKAGDAGAPVRLRSRRRDLP